MVNSALHTESAEDGYAASLCRATQEAAHSEWALEHMRSVATGAENNDLCSTKITL
jgi:hypothetical protein